VVDEVVIGGEVVAVDGSDTGAAGIGDGVGDEAEVVGAAAEEAVGGVGIAVKVEAAEFEISGAGREGAAADIEHGGSVGAAGPDEVDRGGVVVFVSDPGGRGAAGGGREGRGEGIGTAEEANNGTGAGCGCGAGERLRRRGGGAGVRAGAGGGSEEGAVGRGGGIVDREVDEGTGGGASGVVNFGGQGVWSIGERVGVEGEGPVGGAGGIGEGAAIDGELDGGDGQTVRGDAGDGGSAGDGSAIRGAADRDRGSRSGHDVNAETGGGRTTGGILDRHGKGECPGDCRSARKSARRRQAQASRKRTARNRP